MGLEQRGCGSRRGTGKDAQASSGSELGGVVVYLFHRFLSVKLFVQYFRRGADFGFPMVVALLRGAVGVLDHPSSNGHGFAAPSICGLVKPHT